MAGAQYILAIIITNISLKCLLLYNYMLIWFIHLPRRQEFDQLFEQHTVHCSLQITIHFTLPWPKKKKKLFKMKSTHWGYPYVLTGSTCHVGIERKRGMSWKSFNPGSSENSLWWAGVLPGKCGMALGSGKSCKLNEKLVRKWPAAGIETIYLRSEA